METPRRKTPLFSLAAVIFLLCIASPPVSARIGRGPVSFDDPTVAWRGVWEARGDVVYASRARFEAADVRLVRGAMRLAYGWRDRTEFALEVPYLSQSSKRDALDRSGLSDVTLEIKYQMNGDDRDGASSAASLIFGHGPNSIIGSDGFLFGVRYRMARRLFRGQGNLELGYTHFGDRPDGHFNWGIAYEDPLGERGARWSIEILGNAGYNPRFDGDVSLLAGIAYPVAGMLEARAAAGIGVAGDASPKGGLIKVSFTQAFGRQAEESFRNRSVRWEAPQGPSAAEWIREADAALRDADYEKAAGLYLRALEKEPNEPSAWNNLGVTRYAQGRIREAGEAFRAALAAGKEDADVYFNLGLVEYRLGNLPEARRNFMKALERDPRHDLARQNLTALEAPRVPAARP